MNNRVFSSSTRRVPSCSLSVVFQFTPFTSFDCSLRFVWGLRVVGTSGQCFFCLSFSFSLSAQSESLVPRPTVYFDRSLLMYAAACESAVQRWLLVATGDTEQELEHWNTGTLEHSTILGASRVNVGKPKARPLATRLARCQCGLWLVARVLALALSRLACVPRLASHTYHISMHARCLSPVASVAVASVAAVRPLFDIYRVCRFRFRVHHVSPLRVTASAVAHCARTG